MTQPISVSWLRKGKERKGNVIEKESKDISNSNPVRNSTMANIAQITSEADDSFLTDQRERISNGANTSEQSFSSSGSVRPRPSSADYQIRALHFNQALTNIIHPRTRSDRTCFRNVTNWLIEGCAGGRFNSEIFDRVLDYAKEARIGQKPAAVFMALLKKELGYKKGRMSEDG